MDLFWLLSKATLTFTFFTLVLYALRNFQRFFLQIWHVTVLRYFYLFTISYLVFTVWLCWIENVSVLISLQSILVIAVKESCEASLVWCLANVFIRLS
jgi:hypothetical protein